jgi:hypothetical protein
MQSHQRNRRRNSERGYALLMILFIGATMALAASVVTISTLTEGRREKEQLLAWRGEQYIRAIRLYYKHNGKFPQSLDDLTKYVIDQPRFLRQQYKDPFNKEDGSWRLIYVLPNGQFVGSVMHKGLQGSLASLTANSQGANPATAGGTMTSSGSVAPTGTMAPPANPGQPPQQMAPGFGPVGAGQAAQPDQSQNQNPDQNQTNADSQNPIFGGNIIGVASKVKEPSIRVYEGGKTYYQWEFIWDPTAKNGVASQQGNTSPGQQNGQPGTTPGQSPTTPQTPGQPGTPQIIPQGPGGSSGNN